MRSYTSPASTQEKPSSLDVEDCMNVPLVAGAPDPGSPSADVVATHFLLMKKMKSAINEVVSCLGEPNNTFSVDDFIVVTEDCLRALKTIKVERRIESRRANAQSRSMFSASPVSKDVADLAVADNRAPPDPGSLETGMASSSISYKAALLKQKKVSPKRSQSKLVEPVTRDEVEAARHASALRSEERHRQAEERRLDRLQELKQKLGAAGVRSERAKARREEAVERHRHEAQDRMENGLRRAEVARQQTKVRAHCTHTRVDEVRFANEIRQQTKALLLDKKMTDAENNQEQMREERQRQVQERHEAILAAAERRSFLSQERIERQQLREQQRQESLRRVEAQKRIDLELKHQRAEEWEKKVHQHHRDAHAEAEALSRKTEMKFQHSAQILEERRERLRQKLESQEMKLKEAKQRRDREIELKPTYQEVMPGLTEQEEEQLTQRFAKLVASSSRLGKNFMDSYQKESSLSPKDLNRSKLRALFSRLLSFYTASSLMQCKEPLRTISTTSLADTDHEFIRFNNHFELLVKLLTDASKSRDGPLTRHTCMVLQVLLCDDIEGGRNAIHFVRSGNAVPLILAVRDEVYALKRPGNSGILCLLLKVVDLCLERVSHEALANAKTLPVRDQMLYDMDIIGLDHICCAIAKLFATDDDLEITLSVLRILYAEVSVLGKRRGECKWAPFQSVVASLFTLLQNILTPHGAPLTENSAPLSSGRVNILFCAFRLLNMLARWQLSAFQELLHDKLSATASAPAGPTPTAAGASVSEEEAGQAPIAGSAVPITRMELFHILNAFFTYLQGHMEDLELIPPSKEGVADAGASVSFEDALKFGLVPSSFCPYRLIKSETSPASAPEGEEPLPHGSGYHLRAALHECILLVGYLSLDDVSLQEMLSWGKGRPLLENMLTVLPIQYFSQARHILYPTILCVIWLNGRNTAITRNLMDLGQLFSFITAEYEGLSKKAKTYAQEQGKVWMAIRAKSDPRTAMITSLDSLRDKSWGSLMDEDEKAPNESTTNDVNTTVLMTEKEKLCKSFKTSGVTYASFFRAERRFPVIFWPSILETLGRLIKT